jgi:hypothetical protein
MKDAAKLVFKPLFGSSKKDLTYVGEYEGEPDYWDPWDQLLVGFVNVYFPTSKTYYYFELGTDDSRANLTDLKAHWDHSIGYILGFKKYGIMGNKSLLIAWEVMSTRNSANTRNPKFYRGDWRSQNFNGKSIYLESTYQGRRWGAYLPDSNINILMLGFIKNDFSVLFSYNYSRHGIVGKDFPEKKYETIMRINIHNKNIIYSLYIENEKIYNYDFKKNIIPQLSNVVGLGIHYNLDIKK